MNYTALRQKIMDFSETDEQSFLDNIDGFIRSAEERVYNAVQLQYLRKNVIGTILAGKKYLPTPPDFLSVYSVAVITPQDEYRYLLNKDVNFLREAYPSAGDMGEPRYYAIFGPTTTATEPAELTDEISLLLAPTPDIAYDVELHYFFYPESIVTAGTTWLGDNFDSVLFYGAMREAAMFQRMEDDVVKNYEQKYNEAMTLLKMLGDGKQRQDMYRTPQVRYPVK
jgi:hypothetical protein